MEIIKYVSNNDKNTQMMERRYLKNIVKPLITISPYLFYLGNTRHWEYNKNCICCKAVQKNLTLSDS